MQRKLVQNEKGSVEEISLRLDEYTNNNYLTHNFHPYPAKFIPQIPAEIILNLSQKGDWILDPFCGSGTTLVEAKLHGRNAIGIDVNPLSCIIAKTKTTFLSSEQISNIKTKLSSIHKDITTEKEYILPKYQNINQWFNPEIQKDLTIIKHHIDNIQDEIIKDFLIVAFSSIIVKVSNQDSDTRYVAVKKHLKKNIVWDSFQQKIDDMLKRIVDFKSSASKTVIKVYHQDSREMDSINQKIDLIITSPPYPNSYDYYLYHKHRMLWIGLDYRTAQEKEFGSRHQHSDKNQDISHYIDAMTNVISSSKRILKKEGYFCIVVGDAILKGKLLKMNNILDKIFQKAGFVKSREIKFNQRKYTRTFTPNLKRQYKDSYVLIYQL